MSSPKRLNGEPIPESVTALRRRAPPVRTVGELRALLSNLPDDLPIGGDWGDNGQGVCVQYLIPSRHSGPWATIGPNGLRGAMFLAFVDPDEDDEDDLGWEE